MTIPDEWRKSWRVVLAAIMPHRYGNRRLRRATESVEMSRAKQLMKESKQR